MEVIGVSLLEWLRFSEVFVSLLDLLYILYLFFSQLQTAESKSSADANWGAMSFSKTGYRINLGNCAWTIWLMRKLTPKTSVNSAATSYNNKYRWSHKIAIANSRSCRVTNTLKDNVLMNMVYREDVTTSVPTLVPSKARLLNRLLVNPLNPNYQINAAISFGQVECRDKELRQYWLNPWIRGIVTGDLGGAFEDKYLVSQHIETTKLRMLVK